MEARNSKSDRKSLFSPFILVALIGLIGLASAMTILLTDCIADTYKVPWLD